MSLFDIADRLGNRALAKVAAGLLAFLLLQAIRMPLLFTIRVIEGAMKRADSFATSATTAPIAPQPPPVSERYPEPTTTRPEGEGIACAA